MHPFLADDCIGPKVEQLANELPPGGALLLENLGGGMFDNVSIRTNAGRSGNEDCTKVLSTAMRTKHSRSEAIQASCERCDA